MSVNPGPFGCYDTKVCISMVIFLYPFEPTQEIWYSNCLGDL